MIKKGLVLFFIVLILFSGCTEKDIENNVIENVIKKQLQSIEDKDMKNYLTTIDKTKPEYVAERKSWFRDIVFNNITTLDMEIIEILKTDENFVEAKIKQEYSYNNKEYSIVNSIKYVKRGNDWVDSDLIFSSISSDNFIIYYPKGEKEKAEIALRGAQRAYKEVYEKTGLIPEGKTVIKLYEDKERLRQSVKLSFPWRFSGWYEYPESIKCIIYNSKDKYFDVISHELVHKVTIKESNNNLPYWFAEGLAVYYTELYNVDIFKMNNTLDINKLEKLNLEKMEDNNLIRSYYTSSGLILNFIADKYGEDKIVELVKSLGEFPYVEGTNVEVDKVSIERFHKVIPKVLGITVKKLNEEWNNYEK
ncbi:MAG: hypothetical protein FH751_12995 [Firmicutes bacterium]|nr:hypothetical protein [Bacillota bacterium]